MRTDEARVSLVLAESGETVGGTERVVWELATRLPAARFDVRVWLSTSPGIDEFAGALEARGIPVDRVSEVDSRWDWKGMFDTWRRLRRAGPRLLHVHHVWPAADRYLATLAGVAGVPHLVVTEHIVGRTNSPAQRALKRGELEGADAVTAVCASVADSLVRDYGVERSRVRVVPNGTDPPDDEAEAPAAREYRDALGASAQRPLWVCAARLEEQKGQAVLLDALAEVKRRGLAFTAVFAGEGSLRAALEARVQELGLAKHVLFLGQVEEIGPLLLAADAVALPSLWEGLPLSLLEALVRARPVVATSVGGIPEVIEDGVSGALVDPSDPIALADVLESFHHRPDLAIQLGLAGAQIVRQGYSWTRVIERFEAVYDEVLGLASFAPAGSRGRGDRTEGQGPA
jgi:glycosyltransferase involved in cell wall biosynthesis